MSDLARVETRRAGATQLVRITGELDLSNARELTDAVGQAVPDDITLVVVDLTGTTYLDSAAIASFFRLSQRLRDRRQDLRIVVPEASPVRAVVELTRLSQVIPVDESAPDLTGPMAYAALPQEGAPRSTQPPPSAGPPSPEVEARPEATPEATDTDGAQRSR
jgi:anti-anti-sigma factor